MVTRHYVRNAIILISSILVMMSILPASGSYTSKPARPNQIEYAKYHLGKQIFSGKYQPKASSPGDQAAQQAVLETLERQLPESARRKSAITQLAGRLNQEELEALDYYLTSRYRLQKDR